MIYIYGDKIVLNTVYANTNCLTKYLNIIFCDFNLQKYRKKYICLVYKFYMKYIVLFLEFTWYIYSFLWTRFDCPASVLTIMVLWITKVVHKSTWFDTFGYNWWCVLFTDAYATRYRQNLVFIPIIDEVN